RHAAPCFLSSFPTRRSSDLTSLILLGRRQLCRRHSCDVSYYGVLLDGIAPEVFASTHFPDVVSTPLCSEPYSSSTEDALSSSTRGNHSWSQPGRGFFGASDRLGWDGLSQGRKNSALSASRRAMMRGVRALPRRMAVEIRRLAGSGRRPIAIPVGSVPVLIAAACSASRGASAEASPEATRRTRKTTSEDSVVTSGSKPARRHSARDQCPARVSAGSMAHEWWPHSARVGLTAVASWPAASPPPALRSPPAAGVIRQSWSSP